MKRIDGTYADLGKAFEAARTAGCTVFFRGSLGGRRIPLLDDLALLASVEASEWEGEVEIKGARIERKVGLWSSVTVGRVQ